MVLWSYWDNETGVREDSLTHSGVDVRALTAGRSWAGVNGWPANLRYILSAQPAVGGQILLTFEQSLPHAPGYLVNARTLAVRGLPTAPHAPAEPGFGNNRFAPGLWTGAAVIAFAPAFGAENGPEIFYDNMAALDPASGQWYRLPTGPPHQAIPWPLAPVWGGDTMYVTNGTVLWSFGP
jgi:hypothetical protein